MYLTVCTIRANVVTRICSVYVWKQGEEIVKYLNNGKLVLQQRRILLS